MNLEEIKGLGPKTITLLAKLNINSLTDLVMYYPFRYNILKPSNLALCIDNNGLINGLINSTPQVNYIKRNFNRLSFLFLTENKLIKVVIFNRAFLKPHLLLNKKVAIMGKYNPKTNNFTASDIKLDAILKVTIEPVYHLVNGLTNKQINKIITNVLEGPIEVPDYVPKSYNLKYQFMPKIAAIDEIQHPTNLTLLKQAKVKLIYEEFFQFMFKMNYLKNLRLKHNQGLKRDVSYAEVTKYMESLPFSLTKDQLTSVQEIYHDLVNPIRMNRLLLGDVGSGKTIVAIIAIYINSLSGYQSAMLAPTEVLARQHYETLKELLPNLKIALMVGSLKSKEKSSINENLINGDINVLIGTHAALNDDVKFKNLGLVITDEQHRFGVNQRKIMQNKGTLTDILYMSATPIPRTYALSLYGDMDLSLIKTKPQGRKEIITKVFEESQIKIVLEAIWEELKKGHQVFVVAPLIEDENETDINDLKKLKTNYSKAFGTKIKIGILHGKMKKAEQKAIIDDYQNGNIQILISTTVIEVGVDIKNATMMIIYNAERFGLATLHQLRGRVGRNDYQSYCFLISSLNTPRLKILEESNDGFYISEKDFELRGEGDLFGVMQSGDMAFKLGDIRRDSKILMQCKEDALNYLNNFDNDPYYLEVMHSLDINN
jgi:ATP-dependent DNA helicase RecG